MQENNANCRQVPISWAGRVQTGNEHTFKCVKNLEVPCRFKEPLTRENIYKELEKTKWPLARVVGMVLRPGGLADFTLKSKESAIQFAQTLNTLESIRSTTAYADRVVEVRIDFIPRDSPVNQFRPILNRIMEKLSEPQYALSTDLISKPELKSSK